MCLADTKGWGVVAPPAGRSWWSSLGLVYIFCFPLFFKLLGETGAKKYDLNFLTLSNFQDHISTQRCLTTHWCMMHLDFSLNIKINHWARIKQRVIKYFKIWLLKFNYSKVPKLKCSLLWVFLPAFGRWGSRKIRSSRLTYATWDTVKNKINKVKLTLSLGFINFRCYQKIWHENIWRLV